MRSHYIYLRRLALFLDDVSSVEDITMECLVTLLAINRDFLYWFGETDPRNEQIVKVLGKFETPERKDCRNLLTVKYELVSNSSIKYVDICYHD